MRFRAYGAHLSAATILSMLLFSSVAFGQASSTIEATVAVRQSEVTQAKGEPLETVTKNAAMPSRQPSALCPILVVGILLLGVAVGGFIAAVLLEKASRSAIYIAKGAHTTLLAALAVMLIYTAAVTIVVLLP